MDIFYFLVHIVTSVQRQTLHYYLYYKTKIMVAELIWLHEIVLHVCFVDRCVSFCIFFLLTIVLSVLLRYMKLLPLWYLQLLYIIHIFVVVFFLLYSDHLRITWYVYGSYLQIVSMTTTCNRFSLDTANHVGATPH